LPSSVGQSLAPREQLALRLPNHSALRQTALRLPMPLVAAATPWMKPAQVLENVGDRAALVIQDGPTAFGQPDTVVAVEGRQWQVLAEGALPRDEVAAAAPCHIIFVCTGNTCRSPLAAGLCRKLLADHLRCAPADLPQHGFFVQSAGLAAMMGMPAADEAIAVGRDLGADLTHHASQPLTIEMLMQADRLFGMTASHLRLLQGVRGITPRLLASDGEDIDDPIGGTAEVYQDCARQIMAHLEQLLPELLEC
jgi:L-threonylcarbamoyladenylate synthase